MKYFNKQGEVGILVSNSYGAGWSSLFYEKEVKNFLLFDYNLVKAKVLNHPYSAVQKYLVPYALDDYYSLENTWNDLSVFWVTPNKPFYIRAYDGFESIVYEENVYWLVA